MCRFYLLFFSAVILFASCSTRPDFTRNDIRVCEAEDFNGYFVPDGVENQGMLYIDVGKLYAEEHQVEVTQRFGSTYVEGQRMKRSTCTLTHYSNPAYRNITEGVDYLKQQYPFGTLQDVEYAKTTGFWTSYPYDSSDEYGQIVVNKLEDLLHNEPDELTLKLDIYTPEDEGNHLRPLLIMIHEGSFFAGDKADEVSRKWCEMFASCGYVAASVNYRLGFNLFSVKVMETAYGALQDVNAAIRYMLAHRVTYKIDPDKLFLAGCSAGAILALNTAFLNDSIIPESIEEVAAEMGPLASIPVTPAYDEPYRIRAVASMWGAVLDPQILKSSPTSVISFHDKLDPVVPYGEGIPFKEFVEKMFSEMPGGKFVGGYLAKKMLPKVYGSYCVDTAAQRLGKRTEIYTSEIETHTLVRDKVTNKINELHEDFFGKINTFFVNEMIGHPINVLQEASDARTFYIEHPENVKECSWSVSDGFITEQIAPSKVRVLLYGNPPEHLITVKGVYTSGIAFEESFSIESL